MCRVVLCVDFGGRVCPEASLGVGRKKVRRVEWVENGITSLAPPIHMKEKTIASNPILVQDMPHLQGIRAARYQPSIAFGTYRIDRRAVGNCVGAVGPVPLPLAVSQLRPAGVGC